MANHIYIYIYIYCMHVCTYTHRTVKSFTCEGVCRCHAHVVIAPSGGKGWDADYNLRNHSRARARAQTYTSGRLPSRLRLKRSCTHIRTQAHRVPKAPQAQRQLGLLGIPPAFLRDRAELQLFSCIRRAKSQINEYVSATKEAKIAKSECKKVFQFQCLNDLIQHKVVEVELNS